LIKLPKQGEFLELVITQQKNKNNFFIFCLNILPFLVYNYQLKVKPPPCGARVKSERLIYFPFDYFILFLINMRKTKIGLWGISLLAIGLFSIGVSFAYNPTSEDTQNLNSLKSQLDLLIVEDRVNLWDFYDQLKTLEVEYDEDSRLEYML